MDGSSNGADVIMTNHSNRSRRSFTLTVTERDMPAILIALSRYHRDERDKNYTGQSLGKFGLAAELKRIRDDLVAQRDAQTQVASVGVLDHG